MQNKRIDHVEMPKEASFAQVFWGKTG